jgi:hypothetical protein
MIKCRNILPEVFEPYQLIDEKHQFSIKDK